MTDILNATVTKRPILHLRKKDQGQGEGEQPARFEPRALQDPFLNELRGQRVNIYLTSGIRLAGVLTSFDRFTVLLEADNNQQLVFKHAIATVMQEVERVPRVPRHPFSRPGRQMDE